MCKFPLSSDVHKPQERYLIRGDWYSLYFVPDRSSFILYKDGEQDPIQHDMTPIEVMSALANLINEG